MFIYCIGCSREFSARYGLTILHHRTLGLLVTESKVDDRLNIPQTIADIILLPLKHGYAPDFWYEFLKTWFIDKRSPLADGVDSAGVNIGESNFMTHSSKTYSGRASDISTTDDRGGMPHTNLFWGFSPMGAMFIG